MSDDPEKEKENLLELLSRVPTRCNGLDTLAREIGRASTEARDAARYEEVIARVMPIESQGALKYFRDAAQRWEPFDKASQQVVLRVQSDVGSLTAIVSGATSNVSTTAAVEIVSIPLSQEARRAIKLAEKKYREKTNLPELIENVKVEMVRLKLDVESTTLRTPVQFLDEAHGAMRNTAVSDPTASVLIPLRSAIDRTIEEVIRRRPIQEETPNRREKIRSIGRHCSKLALPSGHFDRLADDDENLNAELSGEGKRKAMQSAEVVSLFHRATLFLRALLGAVDAARLKQP